jgi:hypothetical protein
MGFQTSVNDELPLPTPGSFASCNPRHALVSGDSQFVAGPLGVTVGAFCWVNGTKAQSYSTGVKPDGIVANELQATITTWLAETTSTINPGLPVVPYSGGDFWLKMVGAATRGFKVYADLSTGLVSRAAAAGTAATVGGTSTASTIAGTTLTIGGTVAGTSYKVGQIITGGTTAAGTVITALVTGTGGAGTYTVNISQTVASAALNSQTDTETKFYVADSVASGEMVKVTSSWSA